MSLQLYTRGVVHPYRLSVIFTGTLAYASKLNKAPFVHITCVIRGPKLWWGLDQQEVLYLGKAILKDCETKAGVKAHLKHLEKYARAAIKSSEKIRAIDLKKFSNKQIIKLLDYHLKHSEPAHGLMSADIDAIDVCFELFLQKKLRVCLDKNYIQQDFLALYRELSVPACYTYLSLCEQAIMEAALKNENKQKQAVKLHKKFWWTSLGWENMQPQNVQHFRNELNKYVRLKNLKEKLLHIKNHKKLILQKRQHLLRQHHLPPKMAHWLWLVDRYNMMHDLRKEMQVKTVYAFYLFLWEAARRFNLNPADLEWLWIGELRNIFSGKLPNKAEIEKRKQAIYIKLSKKGIKVVTGPRVVKLLRDEFLNKRGKTQEIKGLGVNTGKVTGMVKVCAGAKDALKTIKKGDILICGMTMPDYVPAIKKAAAIVTDEGGITCHAAIISRELNIPCIVGTKIATQIFKTGDRVEVDATNGVVRKIN